MNRAQRRKQEKFLRHHGLGKQEAKYAVERYFTHQELEDGQKVRLNYELMIRHPDYKNQPQEFKDFVEEHKNDILTVEWNKEKVELDAFDKKMNVNLSEDTSDPKWLFYSDTLIPLATANIKLEDGTEHKVVLGDIQNENDPRIQSLIQEEMDKIEKE